MWVLLLALMLGVMSGERPPQKLWAPRPLYPDSAEFSDIRGSVSVMIVVDTTGHVKKADIYKSTLPSVFEARALDAAARWVFKPRQIGGRRWVEHLIVSFPLVRLSEGPNDPANTDLDLTVLGKPVSVGDKLEIITTVQVRSPAGMRIVIDFPGLIILTGTERLHEVLGHQGGELVLTDCLHERTAGRVSAWVTREVRSATGSELRWLGRSSATLSEDRLREATLLFRVLCGSA